MNLYNRYKPIGIETNLVGGWQHHALTGEVGSILESHISSKIVKPTTATKKGEQHDR
jgi:hypothetical protein